MPIQYQYRRGLAADWTTNNTILASGEPGYETDTGKMKIGNGTTAWTSLGYSVTGSSNVVSVGNTTINVTVNSTSVTIANSTLSTYLDNDYIAIGNTTVNTALTNISISTGNASVNATVNSTAFALGTNFIANTTQLTFAPNTFNLGSSPTKAANGWAWLPNGMKMNWGVMVVNGTSNATWSSAFGTNAISVTVTPIGTVYITANTVYVPAVNATGAQIRSGSGTATNSCYFLAIGY